MNSDDQIDPFTVGLRAVMESRSIKAAPLSEAAGLGNGAIRDLFRKGSSPKLSTARALADALGMTIEQVIAAAQNGSLAEGGRHGSADLVPVFSVEASAGDGTSVSEEAIIDQLAFPKGYLNRITSASPRNLAIIGVKGESMVPTLHDDDVVMIDTTKKDLSYDGLFVIRDDGDGLLVKRIGRASQRGYVMIIPDNKAYPPVERRVDHIEVIGKVIWMGKKA